MTWAAAPATTQQRLALLGAVVVPLALVAALAGWPSRGPLSDAGAPVAAAPAGALRGGPEAATGGADADGDAARGEVVRLRSGGRDRAVLVQEPRTGPASAVVIVLGPHALTAARSSRDLPMEPLRERGYAVAYPSTLDGDWNAGGCCGSSAALDVDDVGFLRDVKTLLTERYPQVRDRIGLVGYSTGGQMVYRTLCTTPSYARAAVVVAGSLETRCSPRSPMPPTLVVHGLDDTTVPWAFSTRRVGLLDYAPRPALSSMAAYARAGACRSRRLDRTDGRWLMGWDGCTRIAELHGVGMPGSGHGWDSLNGSVYADRFLSRLVA